MLQTLRIRDFILVESLEIPFTAGLNVVTGETGSGKSVLLKALRLLLGARADSSLIRKGCDSCVIEADFSIDSQPLLHLLEEENIVLDKPEFTIKRTLSNSGKSRTYIQGALCKNTFLKTLAPYLYEIVDQHAASTMFSEEMQLQSIDKFGALSSLLHEYQEHYQKLQRLKRRRELMLANSKDAQTKLCLLQEQEKELCEAALSTTEEEELESEYQVLSHAQELSTGAAEVVETISDEEQGALSSLRHALRRMQSLASLDTKLQEDLDNFNSAVCLLQDLCYSLERYANNVEANPYRMHEISERLQTYTKLQKKYGKGTEELQRHLEELYDQIESLDCSGEKLEELEKEISEEVKQTHALADTLTEKRKISAEAFCQQVQTLLHMLEMPYAELAYSLEKSSLTQNGQDLFFMELKANKGELFAPLSSCASGGEMARITLCVKRILCAATSPGLMIFDEIDAGIGGKTATTVAKELHQMAQRHQIILITHFPQVAKRADHHLKIYKKTQNNRTLTLMQVLDPQEQIQELRRMAGEEAEVFA